MINQLKERIEKTKVWRIYHITENDCILKNQIALMEAFIWLAEDKNISSNVPVSCCRIVKPCSEADSSN